MVLGVTGPYCAGKNTFCKNLSPLGIEILDVDIVGHLALRAKKKELIEEFGSKIAQNPPDTTVSRKELAKLVFSDKKKLLRLENIVHPWMKAYISAYIEKNKETHLAINAALLFHLNLDKYCSSIAIIRKSKIIRFLRALRRDSLGIVRTWQRIKNEKKIPYYKMLNNSHSRAEIVCIRTRKEAEIFMQKIGSTVHGII